MLANEFADFFMEKIKKIRDSLEAHIIYDPQATAKDSCAHLSRLPKRKSSTLDAILTTTLKQVLDTIITPITRIVNMSLESGIFASKWKTAIVCPLLTKAGLDLILSNFRPVNNQWYWYNSRKHCTHKLIPDYQSAYRANYSCMTALAKIVNDIIWAMEHQKSTSLMAINLSTAFDTFDCNI